MSKHWLMQSQGLGMRLMVKVVINTCVYNKSFCILLYIASIVNLGLKIAMLYLYRLLS